MLILTGRKLRKKQLLSEQNVSMTEVILGQLRFILWMMCGGMAILAGYDVLRLFRWLVPHGAVWIAVEDLFFLGALPVFRHLFYS